MDPYISPFITDSPFQKNAQEVENIQFQGAEKRSVNGMNVIADTQVNPDPFVREMLAYIDKDGNNRYEEGIDEHTFDYDVKIFISKDDRTLRELFENTQPAAHEVCLFLEDNTGDIFTGSRSYVKVGDNFRADLKKRQVIGEGQTGLLADETFRQHFQNADLDFTDDQIQELIQTGQISSMSTSFMIGLLQALYLPNIILEPLFKWVADGISTFTGFLKRNIKFQPHHWDPEAKMPDPKDTSDSPKMIDNPDFEPVLFPYSNDLIEGVTSFAQEETKALITTVKQFVQQKEREFAAEVDSYITTLENNKDFLDKLGALAEPIKQALLHAKAKAKELADNLVAAADQIFQALAYLGKKLLSTINAFYCGLWNGLMDSIIGIIDLIGLLFRAFAVQADFMKNAQTKIPQAFELLDECIQAFAKIDFGKVASEIADQIMKIDITAFAGKISLERVAYFFGAVVGFIVEIIIGILLTGGVEAVYAAINKLFANGAKLAVSIQASIVKFFGKSMGQLKDDILYVIAKIIEFLQKGTTGVINAIRALFQEIVNTVRLSAELIQEIIRRFKFTKAEVDELERLGFGFVSFEKGVARACKLLRVT